MPRIKNRNGIGMRFWLLRVVRVVFPTLKTNFGSFELLRVVRVVAGSFPDLEKTYFLKTGKKFKQYIRYLIKVYTRMIYFGNDESITRNTTRRKISCLLVFSPVFISVAGSAGSAGSVSAPYAYAGTRTHAHAREVE